MEFYNIAYLAVFALICFLGAFGLTVYRTFILRIATDLVNRVEEVVAGSNMGPVKKAIVTAQLEAMGIRMSAWLSRGIDEIVDKLNATGAWLAKKTQEAASGLMEKKKAEESGESRSEDKDAEEDGAEEEEQICPPLKEGGTTILGNLLVGCEAGDVE